MAKLDEVTDGKIEVIGPDFSKIHAQGSMDMGIVIKVAGGKCSRTLSLCWSGRSITSSTAPAGFSTSVNATSPGSASRIPRQTKASASNRSARSCTPASTRTSARSWTRCRSRSSPNPTLHAEWLEKARAAYDFRNKRLADLTDNKVDEFYSCTLCQSFAPNHVCVVSPERLGLCGAYNWLDCKASFSINPTGPNQPIKLGKQIDDEKGLLGRHERLRQDRFARRGAGSLDVLHHGKPDDGLRLFRVHRDAHPRSQRRDGGQPRRHIHDARPA